MFVFVSKVVVYLLVLYLLLCDRCVVRIVVSIFVIYVLIQGIKWFSIIVSVVCNVF